MKRVSSEKKSDDEDSIRGAHVRVDRPESTRTLVALNVRDLHPFIRPVKSRITRQPGSSEGGSTKAALSHVRGALLSFQSSLARARRNRAAPVCVSVCVLMKILQV